MGSVNGNVSARRGANGEVEYDTSGAEYKAAEFNRSSIGSVGERAGPARDSMNRIYEYHAMAQAKEAALGNLMQSEQEAAIKKTTEAVAAGGGNLSTPTTGGSVSVTAMRAPAGNPGMDDPEANADIDLSTSDTTIRRKAGYRRDSGIRI